eukprot:364341-Chlamydomonas_euryale.AAC.2
MAATFLHVLGCLPASFSSFGCQRKAQPAAPSSLLQGPLPTTNSLHTPLDRLVSKQPIPHLMGCKPPGPQLPARGAPCPGSEVLREGRCLAREAPWQGTCPGSEIPRKGRCAGSLGSKMPWQGKCPGGEVPWQPRCPGRRGALAAGALVGRGGSHAVSGPHICPGPTTRQHNGGVL